MTELKIEGYASLFWTRDLNDDVTAAGAFASSLARTGSVGVKMLHQHDEAEPIGVWDAVVEDAKGLFVQGRILRATPRGRLVAALVEAEEALLAPPGGLGDGRGPRGGAVVGARDGLRPLWLDGRHHLRRVRQVALQQWLLLHDPDLH